MYRNLKTEKLQLKMASRKEYQKHWSWMIHYSSIRMMTIISHAGFLDGWLSFSTQNLLNRQLN